MSSVLSPPPREPAEMGAARTVDPEALIEEARRRARRRRARWAAAALVVAGVAGGAFFAFGGGTTPPRQASVPPSPSRGLPPAANEVATLPVAPNRTVLFAGRGRTLFEVFLPSGAGSSVTLARVAPNGSVVSRHAGIDRAAFLMDLSTGPDGVYAGTSIVKRFADVPDELVRIDPRTLAIRAHAVFPSRVATVEAGSRMWASIGDGRVVRLDPRTLATRASRRLLPSSLVSREGRTLSKPAFGLGSVWVIAGDERKLELVRLDPSTLAVRSTTRVPTHRPSLAQALSGVSADARHVYLVGRAVVAVAADGRLVGRPAFPPNLATASVARSGLAGLTNGEPGLVLLSPTGRVRARTRLRDAGAQIVVGGRDAWFLGDAGSGNGIVHVRLRFP